MKPFVFLVAVGLLLSPIFVDYRGLLAAKFTGFGVEAQMVIDGRDLSDEATRTLSQRSDAHEDADKK